MPSREDGQWFYRLKGPNVWEDLKYLEAFLTIPEVGAALTTRARLHSSGVYKVVNDKLEVQDKDPIHALLQNPNWFQSSAELMRQTQLFHDIFGNEYLYPQYVFQQPIAGIGGIKQLYTIPSNLVRPEYLSPQAFYELLTPPEKDQVKYCVEWQGLRGELDTDKVIHINDNNVDIDGPKDKNLLAGISKMRSLTPAINNIKLAYESRGVILKNRGAYGILSNVPSDQAGVVPVNDKEKKRLNREYAKMYGGLEGQSSVIITNANLKWQQMAVNPDKLGLFKETEEDFFKILDAYQLPAELFVRSSGSTYENQRQARKGVYQEAIIPEANERAQAMNRKFFPDGKLKIIADFSHLPIFQEEIKTKAEAQGKVIDNLSKLYQDKQITQEEYRSELAKVGIGNGVAVPVEVDGGELETRRAQAQLRGSAGGVQGIIAVQESVAAGTTTREAAIAIFTYVYGFSIQEAEELVGQPKTI